MIRKWFGICLMAVALILQCCGGGGGGGSSSSPTLMSIFMTPLGGRYPVGATQLYYATEQFSDGSSAIIGDIQNITWASSDPSVITIDAKGFSTCVAPGQAILSATYEGKTYQETVTVYAIPPVTVTGVTVSAPGVTWPNSLGLAVGQCIQLSAVDNLSDGTTEHSTANCTWGIDPSSLYLGNNITVSDTGLVCGIKIGSNNAMATDQGKSGILTVQVL